MTDLTHSQKIKVLESYGFLIGDRDPARKASYPGRYMVLEDSGDLFPEDDWCVVGDDLEELVDMAFSLAEDFSHFEAVCEDVLNGGEGILHTNGRGAGPKVVS